MTEKINKLKTMLNELDTFIVNNRPNLQGYKYIQIYFMDENADVIQVATKASTEKKTYRLTWNSQKTIEIEEYDKLREKYKRV